MTTFTGSIAAILAGQAVKSVPIDTWHDALQALTDPWTAYTPVWSATGTAVSLGNGTIVGEYIQIGKLVIAKVTLTMGTTTTFGTNVWQISLPVASLNGDITCAVLGRDGSAASGYSGVAESRSSTTLQFWGPTNTVQWGPTIPFTWASTDYLRFTVIYEAA